MRPYPWRWVQVPPQATGDPLELIRALAMDSNGRQTSHTPRRCALPSRGLLLLFLDNNDLTSCQ